MVIGQEKGIIVNEASNGPSGNKEYYEFLVVGNPCETVDIRHWIVDDNNGDFSGGPSSGEGIAQGHMRFTNDIQWSALNPGTIILIYNSSDINPLVPAADENDSNNDLIYVLPTSSNLLEFCTSTPKFDDDSYGGCGYSSGSDNQPIGLRSGGDAMQTRKPDFSFFHGISYGDIGGGPDNLLVATGSGSQKTFYFIDTDYRDVNNFASGDAPGAETPGAANNALNQSYIDNLKNTGGTTGNLLPEDTLLCFGDSIFLEVEDIYDSYLWSDGSTDHNIIVKTPGSYWVRVSDNGCEINDTIQVNVSFPTVDAGPDKTICINDTAQLEGSGNGTPLWSPGHRINRTDIFDPLVYPLNDTTYYLTITDANGCIKTDSVRVVVNNLPNLNASANPNPVCIGDSTILEASGAESYSWTPANPLAYPDSSKTKAHITADTNFTLSGTDVNGCTNTIQLPVTTHPPPQFINGENVTFCEGETGQMELVFDGNNPLSVQYRIGQDTFVVNLTSDTLVLTSDTTQTVFLLGINDAHCSQVLNQSFNFTALAKPTVKLPNDTTVCRDDVLQLPIVSNINGSYSIQLSLPNNNIQVINSSQDSILYFFPDSGTYVFNSITSGTCTYQLDDSVHIAYYEKPTVNINGGGDFCLGDSVLVDILFTGTPDYTIAYYNQADDTTILNSSNNSLQFYLKETEHYQFFTLSDMHCSDSLSIEVNATQFSQPKVSLSGKPDICEGDSTLIQFTFTEQGPFNFNYRINGQNFAQTNYPNNTFSFYQKDSATIELYQLGNQVCDSTFNEQLQVNVFPNPVASVSGSDSICPGDSSLISFRFSGTPNYNATILKNGLLYDVINGYNNDSLDIYVTETGNYTIQALTDSLCVGTTNGLFVLHNYPEENINLQSTGNFCNGDSSEITFSFNGKIPWSVYFQKNGESDSLININKADTGFYVADSTLILIQETFGHCKSAANESIEVIKWPLPDGNISGGGIVCEGDSLLDIFINLTEVAPFSFQLKGPNGNTINASGAPASNTIPVADTGYYALTQVIDSRGCLSALNDSVYVGTKPNPIAFAGNDSILCFGSNYTLGQPPKTNERYLWNTQAFISDSTIANPLLNHNATNDTTLTYVLTAELDGCFHQDSVQIRLLDKLAVGITLSDLLCYNDSSGTINLDVSGGLPGYLYSINGNSNASSMFTGLSEGNYNIVVQDMNNCLYTNNVYLSEPPELTAQHQVKHPTCIGDNNGEILIDANGGTVAGDYQYFINFSPTSDSITGLTAGSYLVEVVDDNNCSVLINSIDLSDQSTLAFDSIQTIRPSCFELCDGRLTAFSTKANSYTLNGQPQSDSLFNNLCADTHYITITDSLMCERDTSITLTEPSALQLIPPKDTTICIGGTAHLMAIASGGTAPYSFQWELQSSTRDTVSYQKAGDYQLRAFDSNNCPSEITNFSIIKYDSLTVDILLSATNCAADEIALSAEVSGGLFPYFYSWTKANDPTYTNNEQQLQVASIDSTTYKVIVSDACETPLVIDSVTVSKPAPPIIDFSIPPAECTPWVANVLNTSTTYGRDFIAEWIIEDGAKQSNYQSAMVDLEEVGCKNIQLILVEQVNGEQCVYTGPMKQVCSKPSPSASFSYQPNEFTRFDKNVFFNAIPQDSVAYSWYQNSTLVNTNVNWQTILETDSTTFCLTTQHITSGCIDTQCVNLFVEERLSLYVPNAFTPDNNGLNEGFVPIVSGYRPETYIFQVFNRWGELIFESNTIGEAWDGTHKGKACPSGIYSYKVYVKEANTALFDENIGSVTLLR